MCHVSICVHSNSSTFNINITNNNDNDTEVLNCANQECYVSSCWDASLFPLVVIARIPKFIPVPVTLIHSEWNFLPVKAKRDFGISAIIAIAVVMVAAATAATAAGLALGTAIPTAHALNNLS